LSRSSAASIGIYLLFHQGKSKKQRKNEKYFTQNAQIMQSKIIVPKPFYGITKLSSSLRGDGYEILSGRGSLLSDLCVRDSAFSARKKKPKSTDIPLY